MSDGREFHRFGAQSKAESWPKVSVQFYAGGGGGEGDEKYPWVCRKNEAVWNRLN